MADLEEYVPQAAMYHDRNVHIEGLRKFITSNVTCYHRQNENSGFQGSISGINGLMLWIMEF